ncbi:MAG: hypothetical protein ACKO7W_03460 [Elainella sp.]
MSQAADSDLDFHLQVNCSGQTVGEAHQVPWPEQRAEPAIHQPNPDPPLPYLRLLHAEPLMPMQERDLAAIRELFDQEDMETIEADILQNLSYYNPELQWDDWDIALSHSWPTSHPNR